ncbi:uncharacterized protein LOC117189466 [Drosophila miranda]|uniref:uncharacterized protein LOC117189466 n=1 Tax=Drosophila miranda TaxID=7229 RepID=UPI00143FA740|nr:uncharacterized protein LOC117189466 [Drosophila miranda]
MWTYMMAAARGDRVNSMMSTRRRPETESPKYGYNLSSRPMYRTTRFVGPASSAPAQLQLPHQSHHQQPGALPVPPPLEEIRGGLFAPFAPTAAISVEQAASSIPLGAETDERLEVHQLHYPRRSWQRTHRHGNQVEVDDDEDDDEDDDDFGGANGEDNQEEVIAPADLQQHRHKHHQLQNHRHQRQQQPHQQHSSDPSYVENGRKLIQVGKKKKMHIIFPSWRTYNLIGDNR